jgi:single-strand DNA-binding protein
MGKSVNKVILIGNVGKQPEVRYTQNGTPVASFSLATTESFKGQDGEWQDKTEWHDVVCWRFLAERVEKFVNKGSRLYIEGKLQTRSWEGQDGKKNYRTEVVASDLMMLDNRGGGGGGQSQSSGGGYDGAFQQGDVSDDDIPF